VDDPGSEEEVVRVAELFGEVARQLLAEHGVTGTLRRIVELAVASLDACEFAGISLVEGGKVSSPVASGEIPLLVDSIQTEVGEGPCLDAITHHEVFRTGDLSGEGRWPNFSKQAHDETGVCSILSVRLFADERTYGALNMYSSRPGAFDDTDLALAVVFATHASVAMDSARREADLERMVATRDLIGRAKGILMSLEHITDDEAFDLLRRASQRLNIKLTVVAEQVNYTGESPG
jgi:GAF domain-containing protein